MLALLGMAAGVFAIPVQVFIQTRPPREQKGRMIAVMNIFNFIAILLGGIVYASVRPADRLARLAAQLHFRHDSGLDASLSGAVSSQQ